MTKTAEPSKGELKLSWSDRLDLIKNNRIVAAITPFALLAVIYIIFVPLVSVNGGDFLKASVVQGIVNQGIIYATLATSVSLIYSMGDLDISIGAVMALGAVLGANTYNATGNIVLMLVVTIGVCILLMLFNCTLGALLHMKSMTIAIVMMQIYSQLAIKLIGSTGKINVDYDMCKGLEKVFRYPAFIGFFVVVFILYRFTSLGRSLRFMGGNLNCAEQTGFKTIRIRYTANLLAGIGVGIASVLTIVRTGSVSTDTGSSMGMYCMLMTTLGGMSIFGGAKSNTYAGFVGALTYAALNKGLLMVGCDTTTVQAIRGVIFIALVYLNSERSHTLPSRQML